MTFDARLVDLALNLTLGEKSLESACLLSLQEELPRLLGDGRGKGLDII